LILKERRGMKNLKKEGRREEKEGNNSKRR
jgi:hypothetical protein